RKDVGEHGQVLDLRHGLVLVREGNQIEIRIGNHDILGLAPDPAPHIDVAVGPAGTPGIHIKTDARFLAATGSTATAGDVERNRDKIALPDVFDVRSKFDHLAGDLV